MMKYENISVNIIESSKNNLKCIWELFLVAPKSI